MKFNNNNIVRLQESYFEKIKGKLFFSQNIFFIDGYSDDGSSVLLRNINESVPVSDVFPVKIDGIEDRDIYYDPIIAAEIVRTDETIKSRHVDKEQYYLQQLKNSIAPNGKSYYDIIQEQGFEYVHELQNKLPEVGNELKINYKVISYIRSFPSKLKLSDIAVIMTYKSYKEKKQELDSFLKIYIEKEVSNSKMMARPFFFKEPYYVLLFKLENQLEALYTEFYINSSIGKLFLLKKMENDNIKGITTITKLRNLVIRWVDVYKESCAYLEKLIYFFDLYRERLGEKQPALLGMFGFLSQVRDAMVMEIMMPELFKKAKISILKKWKRDTNVIMLDFYLAEDNSKEQIELVSKLMTSIASRNDGIVNEMSKYRIYMLEFMQFAEQNKFEL